MIQFFPATFIKTVASAGTPEVLSSTYIPMSAIMFIGEKAYDTNNAGNIHIQTLVSGTWTDTVKIQPGQSIYWPITGLDGVISATEFRIRVENDGDGVRVIFSRTNS